MRLSRSMASTWFWSASTTILGDLELTGQYDHPKVRECYSRVIEACRKHGKHCGVGGLASRPDLVAEYVKMGARYVSTGTDIAFLLTNATGARQAGQGHQALMAEPKASSRPRLHQRRGRRTPSRARCFRRTACRTTMRRLSPTAWSMPTCAASTPTACAGCRSTSNALRKGLINPRPTLEPKRVTPVAATLDGENGFGFVIGLRAMEEAIAMAREYGIGVVSVKRSTHFGMAASYAIPAVEAGMMAMVFSNASPAMPPWQGKSMLLGTNPFCMAAPAGKHRPIILDMSPAVAARGKIRRAERRGEPIPLGYALDAEGKPTTDPKAALAGGVVLPIGGPKGFAPRCSWTSSAA